MSRETSLFGVGFATNDEVDRKINELRNQQRRYVNSAMAKQNSDISNYASVAKQCEILTDGVTAVSLNQVNKSVNFQNVINSDVNCIQIVPKYKRIQNVNGLCFADMSTISGITNDLNNADSTKAVSVAGISSINERLNEVEEKNEEQDCKINEVKERVDEQGEEINTIDKRLTSVEKKDKIQDARMALSEIETQKLTTRVETLEGNNEEQDGKINVIDERLTTLENIEHVSPDSVEAIEERLTAVENKECEIDTSEIEERLTVLEAIEHVDPKTVNKLARRNYMLYDSVTRSDEPVSDASCSRWSNPNTNGTGHYIHVFKDTTLCEDRLVYSNEPVNLITLRVVVEVGAYANYPVTITFTKSADGVVSYSYSHGDWETPWWTPLVEWDGNTMSIKHSAPNHLFAHETNNANPAAFMSPVIEYSIDKTIVSPNIEALRTASESLKERCDSLESALEEKITDLQTKTELITSTEADTMSINGDLTVNGTLECSKDLIAPNTVLKPAGGFDETPMNLTYKWTDTVSNTRIEVTFSAAVSEANLKTGTNMELMLIAVNKSWYGVRYTKVDANGPVEWTPEKACTITFSDNKMFIDCEGIMQFTNLNINLFVIYSERPPYTISSTFTNMIINLIYPVGSVYISMTKSPPMYGTWELLTDGTFLMNSGGASGVTGGSATTSLSVANLPSHGHSFSGNNISGSFEVRPMNWSGVATVWATNGTFTTKTQEGGMWQNAISGTSNEYDNRCDVVTFSATPSGTVNNTGSGTAFNNLPPYVTCYMYKRIQ